MRKLALLIPLLALGCGGTKYKIVPVEGKIVLDNGQALPTGTKLLLNPAEGGVGSASGVTDAKGGFKLQHLKGKSGAEEGKYTLVLRAPDGQEKDFYKKMPVAAYEDGIPVEIKEGMAPLDLKVSSK
jgi:hypothetical protein